MNQTFTYDETLRALLTHVEACICIYHEAPINGVHLDYPDVISGHDNRSYGDWAGELSSVDVSSANDVRSNQYNHHYNHPFSLCAPDGPEVDSATSKIEDLLYTRVAVGVCMLGLIGNAASVAVLAATQRKSNNCYQSYRQGHNSQNPGSMHRPLTSQSTVTLPISGRRSMGRMQRFAVLAMAALSMSDALFCLSVLPLGFVERDPLMSAVNLSTVYSVYGETIINVFVVSSTWLTVAMAVGRFTAALKPLQARVVIGRRMAMRCIFFVFVSCTALNIPRTVWNDIRSVTCQPPDSGTNGSSHSPVTYYFRWHGYLHAYNRPLLERTYFWIYSLVAILVPLAILIIVSAWLVVHLRWRSRHRSRFHIVVNQRGRRYTRSLGGLEGRQNDIETVELKEVISTTTVARPSEEANIRRSREMSILNLRSSTSLSDVGRIVADERQRSSTSSSYMLTLIAVAVTHVALVCPAELLTFARQCFPLSDLQVTADEAGNDAPTLPMRFKVDYNFLAAVLNTIQTINFAFNFALYLAVNVSFRRLFLDAAALCWSSFADLVLRIVCCRQRTGQHHGDPR